MVGGILNVHYSNSETGDQCNKFSSIGLGNAEAVIYVIESINKNSTLLPNVTIGYDLRDCCRSNALAMEIAYDFMRDSDPVCISTQDLSQWLCHKQQNQDYLCASWSFPF